MRIAVVPSFGLGSSHPLADSSFAGWWYWMCKLVEKYSDVFVYYLVRKDLEHAGLKHERIEMLYEDEEVGWYVMQGQAPASFSRMFSPILGRYPIDAVITDRSAAVPWMARALLEPRLSSGSVIPILLDELTAIDEHSKMQAVSDVDLIARMVGYVLSWTSFKTEWERDIAFRTMKKYLSTWAVNEVWKRSWIGGRQLQVQDVEEVVKGVKRAEVPTLFVGQRLNATKRGQRLLEVYDLCYAAGRDIRIVATSPRLEAFTINRWRKHMKVFPEIEFVPECSREEFLKRSAQAHVALNLSEQSEGFSLGFFETLLCGPVGVFRADDWVEAALGKDAIEGYPYVFRSEGEAAAMIRMILNNYDEAQVHAEKLRNSIRAVFENVDNDERWFDFVRVKVKEAGRKKLATGMQKLFRSCVEEMRSEFTLDELWDLVVKNSTFLRKDKAVRGGQASKTQLYWWLSEQGFVDLCDCPVARYKISED